MPKGNRSAVKQRVIKKRVSGKKRKAFKGTSKYRKIAENASKRPRFRVFGCHGSTKDPILNPLHRIMV